MQSLVTILKCIVIFGDSRSAHTPAVIYFIYISLHRGKIRSVFAQKVLRSIALTFQK